jgi:hypothetical protein
LFHSRKSKEREPLVTIKIDGSGELGNKAEEAVRAKDRRIFSATALRARVRQQHTGCTSLIFYSRFKKAFSFSLF